MILQVFQNMGHRSSRYATGLPALGLRTVGSEVGKAGLAISALATPSSAQRAEDNNNMSGNREKALRECASEAGKMPQSTWGTHQMHKRRSCMMQHGEQE